MSIELAQRLQGLADKNRCEALAWIQELTPAIRRSLFIEVCRALDSEQVARIFSPSAEQVSYPDFDLMLRGWNSTLAATLTPDYHALGIPAQPSNAESLWLARSILRHMGISDLLTKTATMVKHGLATGDVRSDGIYISSDRVAVPEHFLDQVEVERLAKLQASFASPNLLRRLTQAQVEEEMRPLVFPWDSPMGRGVGYGATPALDEHYMAIMAGTITDWGAAAGIHPESNIMGAPGWMLIAITNLIASWSLKHMGFVDVGSRVLEGINVPVSLTIWKTKAELIDSLVVFTKEDVKTIRRLLDQLIVTPNRTAWFATSVTPYVPLLVQISDEQIIRPLTSVFRNPLQGARAVLESEHPEVLIAMREPREGWMKGELDDLFRGSRYRTINKPVMLKRSGSVLTDVDACVLDVTSGELALFQLKWQDYGTYDIARQRSQGKNFVTDVDLWARKVDGWITEFGAEELLKSLQFKHQTVLISLFAIGRFAARFQSFGVVQSMSGLAVCTWPQLKRLRYELGPVSNVLGKLHRAVRDERDAALNLQAVPHEVSACGERIVLKNNWILYSDEA